ncbi:MAG: cell division topological specificity factor MinE [Clostridia bacterium]|nr:cell division topological specificity factor MinE [Clostridia bacterium]
MATLMQRLFGDRGQRSKDVAKERLRLVLVHDRASVAPNLVATLKEDILQVLRRYMEIDEDSMELDLSRQDDSVALVASIPVRRLKRGV